MDGYEGEGLGQQWYLYTLYISTHLATTLLLDVYRAST